MTFDELRKSRNELPDRWKSIEARITGNLQTPLQFTSLQQEVFKNDEFWDISSVKHLIIQGATSSGKTLVSELLTDQYVNSLDGFNVIVLVPLKALVHDRLSIFEKDFPGKRVYASSSDYIENDEKIMRGNFDIAVMVYEKLFQMINEGNSQILSHCGLIVVDEMQLVSNRQRGPKLEISLQKVLQRNASARFIRIMCLTTTDIRVTKLRKWLGEDDDTVLCISNSDRPVGIDEFIVREDGTGIGYHTDEHSTQSDRPMELKLKVENYGPRQKDHEWKQNLLNALLKEIYQANPNAKVLVFIASRLSSQNFAERTAAFIKNNKDIFPFAVVDEKADDPAAENIRSMMGELRHYEYDEAYPHLNKTLPHRIAYHNASVSAGMREFLETNFYNGNIALMFATETLTIGMNMPVDAMILLDDKVRRDDAYQPLSAQEYKNFIGRAGRYGLSAGGIGKSYLLCKSDDYERCKSYLRPQLQEISSALSEIKNSDFLWPYLLSMMESGNTYTEDELATIYQNSLAGIVVGSERIRAMCDQYIRLAMIQSGQNANGDECYSLTDLGRSMIPYALRHETNSYLMRVFLSDGWTITTKNQIKQLKLRGMPPGLAPDSLENDSHLLDILYQLCRSAEYERQLQINEPPYEEAQNRSQNGKVPVSDFADMLKECMEAISCSPWSAGQLKDDLSSNVWPQETEVSRLYRALILYYWTKGDTITQIRNHFGKYGGKLSIFTGDIARMAEAISYQLDEVYHASAYFPSDRRLRDKDVKPLPNDIRRQLYLLSTRIKYGMDRNLVVLANCHVHGMDRANYLRIGQKAEEFGMTPALFLKNAPENVWKEVISPERQKQLLERVWFAYLRDANDDLRYRLDKAGCKDTVIQAIADLNLSEQNTTIIIDDCLKNIFCPQGRKEDVPFQKIKVSGTGVFTLSLPGNSIQIAFLHDPNTTADDITDQFGPQNYGNLPTVLLVPQDFIGTPGNVSPMANGNNPELYRITYSGSVINNVSLAMRAKDFTELLVQCIEMRKTDGHALMELLADQLGALIPSSPKQQLRLLLQNYIPNRTPRNPGALRVVCNRQRWDFSGLAASLNAKEGLSNWYSLSWGTEVYNEYGNSAEALLLLLNWEDVAHSRSLRHLEDGLRQTFYHGCKAIFRTEEDFKAWCNTNGAGYSYDTLTRYIPSDLSPAQLYPKLAQEARLLFVQHSMHSGNQTASPKYRLGVSYSHNAGSDIEQHFERLIRLLASRIGMLHIYYDQFLRERNLPDFTGNDAQKVMLQHYEECDYYVVLDEPSYNRPNCNAEFAVIQKKLPTMAPHHLIQITVPGLNTSGCFSQNKAGTGANYSCFSEYLPNDDAGLHALCDDLMNRVFSELRL